LKFPKPCGRHHWRGGFEGAFIGETITDSPDRTPLPFVRLSADDQMQFAVNDGPLAGQDASW